MEHACTLYKKGLRMWGESKLSKKGYGDMIIPNTSTAITRTLLLGYLLGGIFCKERKNSGGKYESNRRHISLDASLALGQIVDLVFVIRSLVKEHKKTTFPFLERDRTTRYNAYQHSVSKMYKYLTNALLVIGKSEFIIEVLTAKLKGKNSKSQMNIVVFVEMARFIVHMGILASTEYRTVISKSYVPLIEGDLFSSNNNCHVGDCTKRVYPMYLYDKAPSALIEGRVTDLGAFNPAELIAKIDSDLRRSAEIIYHARYLIYAILQMKYGRNSLIPWLVTLCVETTSIWLRYVEEELNDVEHLECARRIGRLGRYLFCPPFFNKTCGTFMDVIISLLQKTNILSPLAGI